MSLIIEAYGKRVTVPGIALFSAKKCTTPQQERVAHLAYEQGVRDALRAVSNGHGARLEAALMGSAGNGREGEGEKD